MLDEAARALLSPDGATPSQEESNLLDSDKDHDFSGQRALDSDEMDDEMMDEYSPAIVPGWKISDDAQPSETGASETTDH